MQNELSGVFRDFCFFVLFGLVLASNALFGLLIVYYDFQFCIFKGLCVCLILFHCFLSFFFYSSWFACLFSKQGMQSEGWKGGKDLGGDEERNL